MIFQFSDTLPALKTLEDNIDVLTNEFKALKDETKTLDPEYNPIGAWRFFGFHRKGRKNPLCCDLCPETVKLVEGLGDIYSSGYSSLKARSNISRHTDAIDVQTTRVHLCLQASDVGSCMFWVNGEYAKWRVGKAFAFDPLLPHEGVNDTDTERVILLLDYRSFYNEFSKIGNVSLSKDARKQLRKDTRRV
jgi:aspartyl/asparaginyl beta-hydroxylase (cupin superfamily)